MAHFLFPPPCPACPQVWPPSCLNPGSGGPVLYFCAHLLERFLGHHYR